MIWCIYSSRYNKKRPVVTMQSPPQIYTCLCYKSSCNTGQLYYILRKKNFFREMDNTKIRWGEIAARDNRCMKHIDMKTVQ